MICNAPQLQYNPKLVHTDANADTGEAELSPSFPLSTESIYRRGARRWRKLYYASGHAFQAKRFNRVRRDTRFSLKTKTLARLVV